MKSAFLFIALVISQFAFAQAEDTDFFEDEIHMVHSVKIEVIDSVEAMSSYNDEEYVPEPIYIQKTPEPVVPVTPKTNKDAAVKVKKYDKVYTSNKNFNIIYLEADPKQGVQHVHVINTLGVEVLCFPEVEEISGLIRLDIAGLPAGRYQFVLDGSYNVTRELNVFTDCEVAQIK